VSTSKKGLSLVEVITCFITTNTASMWTIFNI